MEKEIEVDLGIKESGSNGTYLEICNTKTGELAYVEGGRFGRLKRGIKKIVNWYKYRQKPVYCIHVVLTSPDLLSVEERNRFLSNLRKYRKVNNLDMHWVLIVSRVEEEEGSFHYLYNLLLFCSMMRFPKESRLKAWWHKSDEVQVISSKLKVKSVHVLIDRLRPYVKDTLDYLDEKRPGIKSFTTSYVLPVFALTKERFQVLAKKFGDKFWNYYKGFKVKGRKLFLWLRGSWKFIHEFKTDWEIVRIVKGSELFESL